MTTRKQPRAAPTPDEFLSRFPPEIQRLANQTRALVKRALPASLEQVKSGWQCIAFYMPGKPKPIYTGFIIPHPRSVTLGFSYGAWLSGPDGLLKGAEEKLVRVRYVSLASARDLDARLYTRLLQQAADIALMPGALRNSMRS